MDEDIALGREIYKGPGYRFYSAQSSGKVIVLKVYEGGHAKEVSYCNRNWSICLYVNPLSSVAQKAPFFIEK